MLVQEDLGVGTIDEVRSRLGEEKDGRYRCPVCGAGRGLAVEVGDTQPVVVFCHANQCDSIKILQEIGVDRPARKSAAPTDTPQRPRRTASLTGMRKFYGESVGQITAEYAYDYADGTPALHVFRFATPDGSKTFRQAEHVRNGVYSWGCKLNERPLYHLPQVAAADLTEPVLFFEGEKDVEQAEALGFVATTTSQGAGKANRHDFGWLKDRSVVVFPDNDPPGLLHARDVAARAIAAGATSVRVASIPCDNVDDGHDLSDFVDVLRSEIGIGDEAIRDEILRLVREAVEFAPDDLPSVVGDGGACVSYEDGKSMKPFPIHVLPKACREIVEQGARSQSVDPAFWAVPMLPILAGCIGSTRTVRLKNDWDEAIVVWAAIAAASGTGKSPGQRQLLAPVREFDKLLHDRTKLAVQQHEKDSLDAAGNKAARPEAPPIRSAVVDDCTMEALACRLVDNPRGLLYAVDELAGWVKSFDKYRSGGDDAEKWLRIYGADPFKIDRKSGPLRDRQMYVERSNVSVVGTIQPKIAASHFLGKSQASGLTARLLFASPPIAPITWVDESISDEALEGWKRTVESMLDLVHDDDDHPIVLALGEDAKREFVDYFNDNGRRAFAEYSEGDEHLAAATSKLRGYVARIAAIVALARASEVGSASMVRSIDGDAMRAGIEIVNWFHDEAERCYDQWRQLTEKAENTLADKVWQVLKESGPMSRSDLRDAFHRNVSASELTAALKTLKGEFRATDSKVETNGRPREVWAAC